MLIALLFSLSFALSLADSSYSSSDVSGVATQTEVIHPIGDSSSQLTNTASFSAFEHSDMSQGPYKHLDEDANDVHTRLSVALRDRDAALTQLETIQAEALENETILRKDLHERTQKIRELQAANSALMERNDELESKLKHALNVNKLNSLGADSRCRDALAQVTECAANLKECKAQCEQREVEIRSEEEEKCQQRIDMAESAIRAQPADKTCPVSSCQKILRDAYITSFREWFVAEAKLLWSAAKTWSVGVATELRWELMRMKELYVATVLPSLRSLYDSYIRPTYENSLLPLYKTHIRPTYVRFMNTELMLNAVAYADLAVRKCHYISYRVYIGGCDTLVFSIRLVGMVYGRLLYNTQLAMYRAAVNLSLLPLIGETLTADEWELALYSILYAVIVSFLIRFRRQMYW
eukprot:CAMPEP_0185040172 /NCGR_PEP_ID=MMETSP1103-20130426/37919_1 /TAXON_ID=36769 /ORGANISM="Paraphysomonas bandaiensis, Strain Caron Lab Isolate" /LENGTH=409 /DNA_ID=CAMNT_0027579363 /DNA_START=50 /DNA_END=1276 /DNA_ORIENTATION=-